MAQLAVHVADAHRMMTHARAVPGGIEVTYADGAAGLVPLAALPEVRGDVAVSTIELPNPYLLIVRGASGKVAEMPWDFVRHFCDASHRPKVERNAARGRQAMGHRLRTMREEAGLTQDRLARAAKVGRVTLLRIERGEQSPRFATLAAIAKAFKRPLRDLLVS